MKIVFIMHCWNQGTEYVTFCGKFFLSAPPLLTFSLPFSVSIFPVVGQSNYPFHSQDLISISLHSLSYSSFDVILENLVLDQL